jgi:ATP-dependent DNA helicase RecQ
VEARQFLSCIARLAQRGERFGGAYVIEILRGARTRRLMDRGHEVLSVYGIGKHRSVAEWRSLARSLLHQRLLEQSQDGYSVLSLNESSWEVLREQRSVVMAETAKADRSPGRDASAAATAQGDELFERLRKLRKQLADAQGLPPYVIFHDATLREMVERRPQTLGQFAGIRGVGEGKLARYGQQFIAALSESPAITQ